MLLQVTTYSTLSKTKATELSEEGAMTKGSREMHHNQIVGLALKNICIFSKNDYRGEGATSGQFLYISGCTTEHLGSDVVLRVIRGTQIFPSSWIE